MQSPAGVRKSCYTRIVPTPILFIPGLACGEGQWREHADFYGAARETAAFELPTRPGLSVAGHLSALGEKLERLRWEKTLLIGHSLGANLAAAFAQENPSRVEAVVLVDPTGDLRQESESVRLSLLDGLEQNYAESVRSWFEEMLGPNARRETRSRVFVDLDSASRESVVSILDAFWDRDLAAVLAGRLDRTLCVDSEGIKGPYAFQRLYPELRRKTIPGTSHWPHLDDPDAFRGALKGFFSL